MAMGRTDCQTIVISWKKTGLSKSSVRPTSRTFGPISDTQIVLLSLSFKFIDEFAWQSLHGEAKNKGQKSSFSVQDEFVFIILPKAKFPIGG